MNHTLTLELSAEVYSTIRRYAETAGISPTDWVVRTLKRYRAPRPVCEAGSAERQQQDARELAELNAAYADTPTPEEQETQRRMWDLQRRQLARETW